MDGRDSKIAEQAKRLRSGWAIAVCGCGCVPAKKVLAPNGKQFPVPHLRKIALKIAAALLARPECQVSLKQAAAIGPIEAFVRWLVSESPDEAYGCVEAIACGFEDHGITWNDLGIQQFEA